MAQQLQTLNSMDIKTAKATLLSNVYENKPLNCQLLLALPNCHSLKAIKESIIEINYLSKEKKLLVLLKECHKQKANLLLSSLKKNFYN